MSSAELNTRHSEYLDSHTKRCLDIILCLLFILPAFVVTTLLGVVILIGEGRPVLFIQRRVGKGGKLFQMPKFRTMNSSVSRPGPLSQSEKNLVTTPMGKILRKYRLDELPQLICVLKGHMSLVGPRPELPNVVAEYEPFQKKRLLARPGLTGLWQIYSGRQKPMHEDIKYDLYYIRKANLWLDIKTLVITAISVLKSGPKFEK